MQIVDNDTIRLKLRDPGRVMSAIPWCTKLADDSVLVPWQLDELRELSALDINVPSPITQRYDWPGEHAPYDHQRATAGFLTLNRRAFCFNEQGTGKTASAIWAADFLLREGEINRVLVICPLSIMESAWRADLFKFAMHRTVDVAYGTREKRKRIINSGVEFVIINYDGVMPVRDDIIAGGFDLIIVDEASHYKNAQTLRWKNLHKLCTPDTWLWMMTGTPAAQSPLDAYGLAKLVNPEAVPRAFGAFKDMVMFQVTRWNWMPKSTAIDTVHRVLQPAIRYTKEQCLDLPDMIYTNRTVELTPQQKKFYEQLRKKLVVEVADGDVTAINAAVCANKLLQVACGAVYTDERDVLEFDVSHRYKVLREVIDESSKKTLVFVPFRHAIDIILEKLRADGITAEAIHGGVKARVRTDIFRRFETTDAPQVLVIQPQAAAHGVTLVAANTVVWWGPVSSLETYAQANARVHRAGQDQKCTVVHLQGAPIEQRIYSMLGKKIDIHSRIVELYKDLLA